MFISSFGPQFDWAKLSQVQASANQVFDNLESKLTAREACFILKILVAG